VCKNHHQPELASQMRTRQKWRPEESCIARCGWVKPCQDPQDPISQNGWVNISLWIIFDMFTMVPVLDPSRPCRIYWDVPQPELPLKKKTTSIHRAFRNRLVKQSRLSQVLHSFYSGRSGAPNAGVPMPGVVRGWDEDLHDRRSLQPTLRYRTN
jgi:hypothetical protein